MTALDWGALASAGLLLLAGIARDIGPLLRAATWYRRGTLKVAGMTEGEPESPFIGGPAPFREAWGRYELARRHTARSGGGLLATEEIFAPADLAPGIEASRGAAIGLLWVAWGAAVAIGALSASNAAMVAAAYGLGGVALGAFWIAMHLLAVQRVDGQARRFQRAVRRRDSLLPPGERAAAVEHRREQERWRREAADTRRNELLAESSEALSTLGSRIAGEIRPALETSLVPVLASMIESLDRLSANVETRQREALDQMATSFREQLTSGLRDEFEALARSLHEAAAWHETVHRDLGELLESAGRLGEGQLAMLRRTLLVSKAVRANAESLVRAERSLELTADRVQGAATTISKSLEGTTKDVVDRLRQASNEMAEQLTQLTDTMNGQMEQTGEQLGRRIQSITLMLQRVASEIDALSREQRARPGGPFPRGY